MTFSLVGSDNPFVPGSHIANIAVEVLDTIPDGYEELAIAGSFAPGPWPATYNAIFGDQYIFNADGSVEANTGGGGGSSRPTSGLIYPRLVG